MRGLVGYVETRNATEFLLVGLHWSIPGYDSSAWPRSRRRRFTVVRNRRPFDRLEALSLPTQFPQYWDRRTRWATHGAPSDVNAHPHLGGDGTLALVIGIIENFQAIKQRLQREATSFNTATDSEAIASLIDSV